MVDACNGDAPKLYNVRVTGTMACIITHYTHPFKTKVAL